MTGVPLEDTRGWVRDLVRSGLLDPDELTREVEAVVRADHPDLAAVETTREWLAEAEREWRTQSARWERPTDYDRLQQAFAELHTREVDVLQGCADHWVAKAHLETAHCRGVAWFTPTDVWHAIDEAMLEVNLWHADTANAAPGDALLDEVLAVFADSGLPAHFDEGRIEVTARWQKIPQV